MSSLEIPDNYKYYWGYQYKLGVDTIAPYLKEIGAFQEGNKVIEVGSAEGGALAALVKYGAESSLGIDIAENRLEMGAKIAETADLKIDFECFDILKETPDDKYRNKYDLAILRDVIEHLEEPAKAMSIINSFLKPGGLLYVTFPPYHSPFGGHQHTAGAKFGNLPYIHLLPKKTFYPFIASGRENDIGEIKRLRTIRLTVQKFEKAAKDAGYNIENKRFYLLRPVFKMKFGLPAIRLPKSIVPNFLKNFFAMEASYLLRSLKQ